MPITKKQWLHEFWFADNYSLGIFWEFNIPPTHAICSGTANTWYFASESALVPFRPVMSHERKFGGKYPPFAGKRQIAAFHIGKRDVLSPIDFCDVFTKAGTQCSLALRRTPGRLSYVNQLGLEVERVDAACLRTYALFQ
jgi:hypothetical protein